MGTQGQTHKSNIPQSKTAILRPRLLSQLENGLDKKLTLVSAPPGYGKTTVVSQLANTSSYSVVWHRVEERERDLSSLYQHCLSAFKPYGQDIEISLPAAEDIPPAELAALFGSYIHQAKIGRCIYILDDIHELDGAPACEQWLRALLVRIPQDCHVVLISRTLPNLSFAEMVARNELVTLGADDLRMTSDEVQELAVKVSSGPLSDSQNHTLASLDGWPAGVALAIQPGPDKVLTDMLGGRSGPEALFVALAQAMLASQPPDLRNFLLGSSVLTYLTSELCEDVLGLPDSLEWLALVQERNLFLTNAAGRLEYHPLFREFLQGELRRIDYAKFMSLHGQAARSFETIDDNERAFDHYMAAGEPKQARRIAENVAIAYFGQGKFETILKWSDRLREVNVLAPKLSFECSMIHIDRYDYSQATAELTRARKGFNSAGDTSGIFKVKLQRATLHFQQGEYFKAIRIANPFAGMPDDMLQGRALRIVGMSYFHLGHIATSIEYLEKAVALYRKQGLVSSLSHLLQDLHLPYLRLGQLDKVGSCLQEVVAIRRKLKGKTALALALISLGYYYHKRSQYQEAQATFEEASQLIAGSPDRRTEGYLLASQGDLYRDLGAYSQAQAFYNKVLGFITSDSDPTLYCAILFGVSTLHRWQGRPYQAAMLADEAFKVASAHHKAFEISMSKTMRWLAQAQIDEPATALPYLQAYVEELRDQKAALELLEVIGGCAYVAACCGNKKAIRQFSGAAIQLVGDVGTAQSLAAEAVRNPRFEAFVPELAQAKELRSDLRKLRASQKKLIRAGDTPGPRLASKPLSIKVFTLGQERVEKNGKLIPTTDWKAAGPRELFFYLLFEGAKRRAEIELTFWPDRRIEQARGSFHRALHCARQALGQEVIVYEDGRYSINLNLNMECDAYQMESWVTQARLLPPNDVRTEDLWHKAVSIYDGDFLPSLDASWVVAGRETLAAMYLDALMGLGDCARARGDYKEAVERYLAALALDPYLEHVYQQVIYCYGVTGQFGKLKSFYTGFEQLFRNELDIEPSQETAALAHRFIGVF